VSSVRPLPLSYFFVEPPSSIVRKGGNIEVPKSVGKVHYEVGVDPARTPRPRSNLKPCAPHPPPHTQTHTYTTASHIHAPGTNPRVVRLERPSCAAHMQVELAVILGRRVKRIPEGEVMGA
jgi:2-keto-4-pentenoate hydratase/2-oxohepta-3-ene-1,7-dioic acid hydratase in catechol pathway